MQEGIYRRKTTQEERYSEGIRLNQMLEPTTRNYSRFAVVAVSDEETAVLILEADTTLSDDSVLNRYCKDDRYFSWKLKGDVVFLQKPVSNVTYEDVFRAYSKDIDECGRYYDRKDCSLEYLLKNVKGLEAKIAEQNIEGIDNVIHICPTTPIEGTYAIEESAAK